MARMRKPATAGKKSEKKPAQKPAAKRMANRKGKPRRLDTEKAVAAMERDPSFVASIPDGPMRDLYRGMIRELPEVLGDLVAQPVTVATYVAANVAVVRHMVSSGFLAKVAKAMPRKLLKEAGASSAKQLIAQMEAEYTQMLPQLETMAEHLPMMLANKGVSDEQFLAHREGGGLTSEQIADYRAGKLTIASLLETDPLKILKFG